MSGLCGPDLTRVGRTLGHSPASQVVHVLGLGQRQGGAAGAPARAVAVSHSVLLSVLCEVLLGNESNTFIMVQPTAPFQVALSTGADQV